MTKRSELILTLVLAAYSAALSACSSSSNGDEDPLRSLPAIECAPECVPASGSGISGPSICHDGCNYCRCTASGPRDCTSALCLDIGTQPMYLPRGECSDTCTAVPAGLYFPDHQGSSACYDGCNACLCTTEGLIGCTARACPPDLGVEEDLGVDQGLHAGTTDQGP